MAVSRMKLNLGADMFPDELVMEFLIRLPGKQVARCKCVCKSWRSVIKSTHFKDVYGSRQRGLILHWFEPVTKNASDTLGVNFYFSPFRGIKEPEQEEFSCLYRFDGQNLRMTQIVNGLLCVAHGTAELGTHLTFYNVCTGESIMIPDPMRDCNDKKASFFLGYDPTSGTYKLLRVMKSEILVQVHIITLSPSSSPSTWRELNHDAAFIPSKISMYMELRTSPSDGFLCWFTFPGGLLLFDLNKEKFHKILLPSRKKLKLLVYDDGFVRAQFMEHQQRLAVSVWNIPQITSTHTGSRRFECFVLDDDEGKRWSQHFIELPRELSEENAVLVIANGNLSASNGEIVLMNTVKNDVFCFGLDHTSKMMARFQVGKLPDRPFVVQGGYGHWWDSYRISFLAKISCLFDGNNLYLPLDDILGGRI